MLAIYRAVRDVSQEAKLGTLKEKLLSGEITAYTSEDMDVAIDIYKTMVVNDLETGNLTVTQLKLIRDPLSILENLTERDDPFDITQMGEAENAALKEEIMKNVEVLFRKVEKRDDFDKATARHLALHQALNIGNKEDITILRGRGMKVREMDEYLLKANPVKIFKPIDDYETDDSTMQVELKEERSPSTRPKAQKELVLDEDESQA